MSTAFAIGCCKNADNNWLKALKKLLAAGRKNMIFFLLLSNFGSKSMPKMESFESAEHLVG